MRSIAVEGCAFSPTGQLLQIAHDFYGIQLAVTELPNKPSTKVEGFQFRLRLNFNNRDYLAGRRHSSGSGLSLERLSLTNSQAGGHNKSLSALSSTVLLQLFPFTLAFRSDLEIISVGCQLKQMYPDGALVKMSLPEVARLRRPKLRLTWDNVIHY